MEKRGFIFPIRTTPIYVDGTLYVTSAFGRVMALDPDTGMPRWSFDSQTDTHAGWGDFANRGAATWLDQQRQAGQLCHRRIFVAPIDARLFALDARTGNVCSDFGTRGGAAENSGTLILARTLVSGNTASTGPEMFNDIRYGGAVLANNHNLFGVNGTAAVEGFSPGATDVVPRGRSACGHP